MRLSNAIREDFVESVMSGIPVLHKYSKSEAVREIVAAMEEQLPDDIKKFAKCHPNLIKRERNWSLKELKYDWISEGKYARSDYPYAYTIDHESVERIDTTKWVDLKKAADKEKEERKELEERLKQITNSCNSLKQLKEALPEFESYMPEEAETVRNLPVAAGSIVTDLLAAGLKIPKGDKNAKV